MTDRREEILNGSFSNDGMEDAQREITTKPYNAVRNAMDEYMKECCLELLDYMAKNNINCVWWAHEDGGVRYRFHHNGRSITKEQLFENFL